jgi:hypothetical protein
MFRSALCGAILAILGGCALPIQPGFPIDESQAQAARRAMERDHKPLVRPLVVLGGYRAPYHVQVRVMTGRLVAMTSGERADALGVAFFFDGSLEESADWAVHKIQQRWPSDDPEWTVEVDVVGISMGGLVARHAWGSGVRTDGSHRRRLRLARLYTIGTPHRGACLAETLAPDKPARQMRAGSVFLNQLDEADAGRDYELCCYARTNDEIVGARRSAPEGEAPYWVHGPWHFSHLTVARDWRIAVDIARRLRGEEPFATERSEPPSE